MACPIEIRKPRIRRPGRRTRADSYMTLVARFRLAPIRGDAQLRRANAMIGSLLDRELDPGAHDYLDVLTDLVEAYETATIPTARVSEGEVVRVLMESNGLTQAQFGQAVGMSQSVVSAVVNGSRKLTREQIERIGLRFALGPGTFLAI